MSRSPSATHRNTILLNFVVSLVVGIGIWIAVLIDQGANGNIGYVAMWCAVTVMWTFLVLSVLSSQRTCPGRVLVAVGALLFPYVISLVLLRFNVSGAIILGLLISTLLAFALALACILILLIPHLRKALW